MNGNEQQYAIKSWRYLRLGMVVLVAGLFASIAYEIGNANCLQTSISAYYYTPVHDYFVAALLAIGVCLFSLRGCRDIEDGLLNLAGMLAPVVALVPTPHPGNCASVFGSLEDRGVNIENNITALIVVVVLAGIILGGLTLRKTLKPPKMAWVMFAVAAAVWIILILVFYQDRAVFVRKAHYAAAIPMFGCILVVVLINAHGYKTTGKPEKLFGNPYAYVGGAMIASSVAFAIAGYGGWDHWVIAIEFALISLFAAFWVTQTIELWDDGLR